MSPKTPTPDAPPSETAESSSNPSGSEPANLQRNNTKKRTFSFKLRGFGSRTEKSNQSAEDAPAASTVPRTAALFIPGSSQMDDAPDDQPNGAAPQQETGGQPAV